MMKPVRSLYLLLAWSASLGFLSSMIGCGKPQTASVNDPAAAEAALKDAFKQAKPEVKSAADEAAAAIQKEPAKALGELQALCSNPDLDPRQRNAAQDSILVLTSKLREAAAQGDAEAEKAMQAYRASK
jgi:hypothetical protein